jgi:SAM-dependent methyltransferase
MTPAPANHACAACRGPLEFFGTRGRYTYEKCSACRSIQLYPLPTPEELAQAYSNDYASSNHYGTDPDQIFENGEPFFRAVTRTLREAGVASGRVLDVGCGWGGMVRVLREEGYDTLGVDYESDSLAYCRAQALPVEVMDLDRLEREGRRFDAILLVTVFEHLVDHRERLERLSALLDPNGVLVVLVPTASLFGTVAGLVRRVRNTREIPAVNGTFEPPWHTTILSVEGFERMVEGTPFVVDKVLASPSGSGRGVKRVIQAAATAVSVGGDRLFGRRWPIVLNHIFVCRLAKPGIGSA